MSDEPDDSDSPPSVFYEGVSRSVDGASLANNIELVGGYTLRVSQEILSNPEDRNDIHTTYNWRPLDGESLPRVSIIQALIHLLRGQGWR